MPSLVTDGMGGLASGAYQETYLRRSPLNMLFFATAAVVPAIADLGCTSSSSTSSLDVPHLTATISPLGLSGTDGGSSTCEQIAAVNVGPNDKAGHLLSPGSTPVSWTISAPQTCVGTPPCGFLELTVYSCSSSDHATCTHQVQVIDSAGPSITVRGLASDAGASSDFYKFHIELFNQDATPAVDRNGKTWPADAFAELNAPCHPPVPPEPDAAPPMRDASMDVSVPPTDASSIRPPDATTQPKSDATTPVDASPPMRDAASDGPLPPAPDARPPDAGRAPDAQTP